MMKWITQTVLLFSVSLSFALAEERIFLPADFNVSEPCKAIISKEGVSELALSEFEENSLLSLTNRSQAKIAIRSVTMKNTLHGYLFQTGQKSILHCFEHFTFPEDILIEDGVGYSMFMLDEFTLTRILIHSRVGCGTSCYSSIVDEIEIPTGDFKARGYRAITSQPYDYPNRWYVAYVKRWL